MNAHRVPGSHLGWEGTKCLGDFHQTGAITDCFTPSSRFHSALSGFVLAIVPTLDLRDTGTTTVTARGHFQSGRAPTGIVPPLQRPRAPRVGRQLGCPGRRRFVGAERVASARPGGAGSTRASEGPGPTLPSAFHQRNTGVLWDKGGCGAATDALAVRGGSLALLSGAACSRVLAK